jgi:hypothetical protein
VGGGDLVEPVGPKERYFAKRDHLGGGDAGVLGVAAVEGAANAAHECSDLLADRELAARRGGAWPIAAG